MVNDYKTVEQMVWESVGEPFIQPFVQGFYGAVVTPFRVPSFIRKRNEEQTLIDRASNDNGVMGPVALTGLTGIMAGLAAQTFFYLNILAPVANKILLSQDLENNDYTPALVTAAILGLTNIASGIYETIRAGKKKAEKLGELVIEPGESLKK